jgi:hypothetical protein
MVDIDEQYLREQSELLRSIRDELRQSHGAAMAEATGATTVSHSPGGTFVRAQILSDQVLSGQWSTLSWANAYKPTFTSSFGADLLALTGIGRAPETLTQSEYEQLAGQSICNRFGLALGGFLAP